MEKKVALSPLIRRLKIVDSLGEEDVRAIEELPIVMKRAPGDAAIVRMGERPLACCLLVDGFVLRSKTTLDGRRQILAIHQAGDIPDLQSLYLHVMDHDVVTLCECVLGFISHAALRPLIRNRPDIAEALWRDTLIDAAIFREWTVNVGQRDAPSRLAHLIMELYTRLKMIGRVKDHTFHLPLTQVQLAEAVGLTSIHVNRTLQQLRSDGLMEFSRGLLTIKDEKRLKTLAGFDPLYLHLNPGL